MKERNMQQFGFSYIVRAELTFTAEEAALLKKFSALHYDGRCRAASKSGGVICRIENMLEYQDDVPGSFTSSELNLLMKVCEAGGADGFELMMKLSAVFESIGDRLYELNKV